MIRHRHICTHIHTCKQKHDIACVNIKYTLDENTNKKADVRASDVGWWWMVGSGNGGSGVVEMLVDVVVLVFVVVMIMISVVVLAVWSHHIIFGSGIKLSVSSRTERVGVRVIVCVCV